MFIKMFKLKNINYALYCTLSFILMNCSYIIIPDNNDIREIATKNKLGVALIPASEYSRKTALREKENRISDAIKNITNDQENSNNNLVLIDTFNGDYEFDNTQEYLMLSKRNIIELEYIFNQVDVNVPLNFLGILTLGLTPIYQSFQFEVQPNYFDSNGKKHTLEKIESPTMDEWKSWFLFPLSFSSEAKETKYIHDILKATLSSALEEIKDKRLSTNTFNSNFPRLDLPFRMKIDKGYCQDRYRAGNLTIIAGTGNTICVPGTFSIGISNKTSQHLRIHSRNFSLLVDGKAIKPLDEIVLRKEKRLLDSGNNTMNLQKSIKIEPGETGHIPVMYFEVPESFREITYLQYIDKDVYKDPIFIRFKLQK